MLDHMLSERTIGKEKISEYPSGLLPQRTAIDGRLVRLEPIDHSCHAEDLYVATHRDDAARELWQYLATGPYSNFGAFRAWLKDSAGAFDPIFYAIRVKDTGKVLGMAGYRNPVPKYGTIEIGHVLFGIGLQRTTAATEAIFLLLRHALDDLRYRRVEWKCDALNDTSHVAARRLGFRYEGSFYQHMIVKGRNRDTAWYSILDKEWPRVRAKLSCWLLPENFDAAGCQRRSLREISEVQAENEAMSTLTWMQL